MTNDSTIYSVPIIDERAEVIILELLERMMRTGTGPKSNPQRAEHIETIVSDLLTSMGYDVEGVRHQPAFEDDKPSELHVVINHRS